MNFISRCESGEFDHNIPRPKMKNFYNRCCDCSGCYVKNCNRNKILFDDQSYLFAIKKYNKAQYKKYKRMKEAIFEEYGLTDFSYKGIFDEIIEETINSYMKDENEFY